MATIRTSIENEHHYVCVRGALLAKDVRRLEEACGRALERRELRLTIDLDNASVPPAACAFLRRLHARGARLTGVGSQSVLSSSGDW